jgi:hypothetical protein
VTDPAAKTTRAQRMAMPLAREVVKDLAVEHGACIRPDPAPPHEPRHRRGGCRARPLGTPWRTSALLAPRGPGRCGRRSAGKAGISRTNPTSSPTRPPTARSSGSENVPRPSSSATGPTQPGRTRTTWTSSSANWTRRSPTRAYAGRPPQTVRRGGTAPPAAAGTPRTCPAARSVRGPWARPTPRRTARPSACPSSSP